VVGHGTAAGRSVRAKGARPMSKFSPQEIRYLTTAKVLGRLATLDRDGQPHVVPVGWRYNAELDTVDISGRRFSATKKFRNAKVNPRVTFLIDEVLPPWRPRAVMIQGLATTLEGGADREAMIRITPHRVISWGLDDFASA
jgi:pyridoxamine 5'-phosphate oxidase family protein